ncbi:hypothetical protein AVEN_233977-1 [Araneus ventricosus]|uniref:Uncharacterized protein n=1 Tax=Araneus ventricosus TaxID=182803 RepID=A0A4Y2NQB9_ARAVE|nr:hypothetical protein AVEN_233977-1 [Araneus ventricosus]
MCGSHAPTVLTLMQEKGESLIRQDRGYRPSDPISANTNDECVLLHPFLCGVLHHRPRTKPLNSRPMVGTYSPTRLSPFFCIEVSTIGASLPKMHISS